MLPPQASQLEHPAPGVAGLDALLGRGRCKDAFEEGIEQTIVRVVLLSDLVEFVVNL